MFSENITPEYISKKKEDALPYQTGLTGLPFQPMSRPQIITGLNKSQSPGAADDQQTDSATTFTDERISIKRRSSRVQAGQVKASLSKLKYNEAKKDFESNFLIMNDEEKLNCSMDLLSYDVDIVNKYQELDYKALLEKNMVRKRINCFTQAFGILEKYASNLIKPNKPTFWRQVKFTSSLVRTFLDNVHGSYDVLRQMGYTKDVPDGLAFDDDVLSPDVEKVQRLTVELFLAKCESEELIHDRHPFLEITPSTGIPVNSPLKAQEIIKSEDSEPEFYDAEDGLTTVYELHSNPPPKAEPSPEEITRENPDNDKQCFVCGKTNVAYLCKECDDVFCGDCKAKFHSNPKRQNHTITEIKSTCDEEPKKISPPKPLQQNVGALPVAPPRKQNVNRQIKKPIPVPRKRIPSVTKPREIPVPSNETMETVNQSIVLPQQIIPDELPPPREYLQRISKSEILPHKGSGLLAQQSKENREIKRPPPLDDESTESGVAASKLQDEHLYESLKMPTEHIYEKIEKRTRLSEKPPPIPPRSIPGPKPATTASAHPTPPIRSPDTKQTVTACPSCYCLNERHVTHCVACNTPLPNSQQHLPGNTSMPKPVYGSQGNQEIKSPGKQFGAYPGEVLGLPNSSNDMSKGNLVNPPWLPSKASNKWECVHCTFHNDMGTNICSVCSKTTDNPVQVPSSSVESGPEYPVRNNPFMPAHSPQSVNPFIPARSQQSVNPFMPAHSTPYSQYSIQQTGPSKPLSTSGLTTKTPSISTESDPLSPLSGLVSPSYIQLQQAEFISIEHSRKPNKEQEGTQKLLHQTRETIQHLQATSPIVSSKATPQHPAIQPAYALPNQGRSPYSSGGSGITSGYGSQEGVSQYFEIEEMKEEGMKFVKLLREAETSGFTAEELNIAYNLHLDKSITPLHWLKTEWFDRIHQVMIEFTNISKSDNFGNLSHEEAREALIEHTGDVEEASKKCVNDRKLKLIEVMKGCLSTRTEIIKALDMHEGNVESSIHHLQKKQFEQLIDNIRNNCVEDFEPAQLARQEDTLQDDDIFDAIVSDDNIDIERRVRVMFAEKDFSSWGRAVTAIQLIDMKEFLVSDAIEAARVNGDLERSLQYLKRDCSICYFQYPESRMVTMLNCQCRFCLECISKYFKVNIQEQNIMKLTCPQCSEPKNLEDPIIAADYFNNLDIVIRQCVNSETHDLFQRKLRDRTLMTEPNFRWCSHCSSGFINEQPNILKMACPNCRKYTCFQCKKEWEDQHDGISCEQFAAWKEANDPEAQANGLAAHLKQNGIECPNCKFRYDLAKGGCMHFKCGQCSHEFCSGCYQPFRHTQHCPVSASCAKRGLHAHHPRDCLFYLRDRDPKELKKLLDDNNVEYDTEPPQRQTESDEEVAGAAGGVGRCKVMEQRETGSGLQDVECGRETPPGFAGLCRLHFSEYLVERINSNFIDPVGVYDIDDARAELGRNDLQMPEKKRKEKDKDYLKRVVKFVEEKLPLPRKTPRRRILDVDDIVQAQDVLVNDVPNLAHDDLMELRDYDSDSD